MFHEYMSIHTLSRRFLLFTPGLGPGICRVLLHLDIAASHLHTQPAEDISPIPWASAHVSLAVKLTGLQMAQPAILDTSRLCTHSQ